MGNCFKTQLKGIVNNENLEYFDSIDISVVSAFTDDERLAITATGLEIDALNGTFDIYNGTTGLTHYEGPTATIQPKTQGMKLLIRHKHTYSPYLTINSLSNGGKKVVLNYNSINTMQGIVFQDINGSGILDLTSFATDAKLSINNKAYGLSIGELFIPKTKVYSNILNLSWRKSNGAELDLTSLYGCTLLSEIRLGANEKVTGELKDLLDALYNSGEGKVSGTLYVELANSGCTYYGAAITGSSKTFTFTSEGWSLNS